MKKGVGLSLTTELLKELEKLARERQQSISNVVCDILSEALHNGTARTANSKTSEELLATLTARAEQLQRTLDAATQKMLQNSRQEVSAMEDA